MAADKAPVSFDEIIQQGRKKRQAELLAQEIFGKRRASAPPAATKPLRSSLASRVGISKPEKRNLSLTRSQSSTSTPTRSRKIKDEKPRPRPTRLQETEVAMDLAGDQEAVEEMNGGDGLYIRGAARGTFTVVASNFAPGTSAADIESVMESVGGAMSRCILVASNPTVIAEMDFNDKSGADKVIETFNNKKADGRMLYVYLKSSSGAKVPAVVEPARAAPAAPAAPVEEVVMEVDENAEARETQDRLREQRRPRNDRDPVPSGPRDGQNSYDNYYDRRPRPAGHMDGRQNFDGDRYGGSSRGRYYENGRRWGNNSGWR